MSNAARRAWEQREGAPATRADELEQRVSAPRSRVGLDEILAHDFLVGGQPTHNLHDHGEAGLTGLRLKREEER